MTSFKKLRKMIEVQGNGNIVSREIAVSSFLRLHLSGKGLIELYPSDDEKVIVETDENLQEYFDVVNSGRTLYVTAESKFKRPVFTKCIIKVYIRQIDMLYVRNDRADVTCPGEIALSTPLEVKIQSVGNTMLNINAPAIKVLCQCEGNVTLKGKCNKLDIKNMCEGNLDASEMVAGELSILNMGEGNVDLFANNTIKIKHFASGYVHYGGSAILKDVRQYGDGEIKHVNK